MIRIVIFCLTLLVPQLSEASAYTVGYYPHFQIDKFKTIVEKSYQDIGIDIEFVEMAVAERAYLELNAGHLDAEVARAKQNAQHYENVVVIEPHILEANMYLLCKPERVCDTSVFTDEKVWIIATRAITALLPEEISETLSARFYDMGNVKSVYSMFESERFDYAVISVDQDQLPALKRAYQSHLLTVVKGYHIINKKHAALADKLSEAIARNKQSIAQ
ncbi:hypothetical protein [Alteromonas facilis]|uniref:hypothetical protein n=1 Tax=Alteromonas facilis TaxID=2048004 RepID=UPI000C284162|nr:hypothetical protein [Alteromonas facilis]